MIDLADITITNEILQIVSELDSFKNSWALVGKISPEKLVSLKKIAIIESIGSSTRIEGVTLSDRQVEELLSNLEVKSFLSRDEQEVAGYSEACNLIFASHQDMNFSENLIKQLHKILLKFSDKDIRHSGEYKKLPNRVEAFDSAGNSIGVVFETASPFDTPFQMEQLVNWFNGQIKQNDIHPLLLIGIFIVHFLAIHPFQDGNGRLSRILTSLLLLQSGYTYIPYSSLESIVEKNKEAYYLALRKTQNTLQHEANYEPWLLFFLQSLLRQKTHFETKLNMARLSELSKLPNLSRRILDIILEHHELNISEITLYADANKNTVKKYLAQLVANSHIVKYGKGKATTYKLK